MKLKASEKAAAIINTLWTQTGIQFIDIARIAFAVSLIKNWKAKNLEDIKDASSKKEFNDYSLSNSEFYRVLLSCLYEKNLTDDEFFSNKSYFKYHVDDWADILWDIRENKAKQDKNIFLIELASMIPSN